MALTDRKGISTATVRDSGGRPPAHAHIPAMPRPEPSASPRLLLANPPTLHRVEKDENPVSATPALHGKGRKWQLALEYDSRLGRSMWVLATLQPEPSSRAHLRCRQRPMLGSSFEETGETPNHRARATHHTGRQARCCTIPPSAKADPHDFSRRQCRN
jgi:hypothetical protein